MDAESMRTRMRTTQPPQDKRPNHFFKIILPTTIIDNKLRLPIDFVKEYENELCENVTLADPNGREWKIGLEKNKDGVWLSMGWESFVKHYSITSGFLIVFKYEGNSSFHIFILGMNAFEIRYPRNDPRHDIKVEILDDYEKGSLDDDEHNYHYVNDNDEHRYHHFDQDHEDDDSSDHCSDDSDYESEETESYDLDENDDFDEFCSSSPSRSPSYRIPIQRKRGFTKFIDEKRLKRKHHHPSKHSSRRERKRYRGRFNEYDQSDSHEDIEEPSIRKRPESRGYEFRVQKEEHMAWFHATKCSSKSYKRRKLTNYEKDKVISAALKYQPEYPSFMVVLRPHNIYNSFVYVPAKFAVKYLAGQPENIKLQSSDGKQWPARCFYREGSGDGRSIGKGWSQFSKYNDLQEGDVCVFELVKRTPIVLKVTTFHAYSYLGK